MSDHEDHGAPETSTVSGAQTMPSANAFADMFKAAMAPVLSQLTNLNENVSSMLLNGHDDSDEDGETASNEEPAKSADMDADLSALLASAGKDANNEAIPGEDLLKELAQDLTEGAKLSQKGQNTLIGAITAMTKAADLALGKYSQDKELITLLTDAVAMALQYNHEVNHSRRLAMKKEMHKDYAAL